MAGDYPIRGPGSLQGRGSECALLDDVTPAPRRRESSCDSRRGGIRKTALLHMPFNRQQTCGSLAAGVDRDGAAFASLTAGCAAAQPWSSPSPQRAHSRSVRPDRRPVRLDSPFGLRSYTASQCEFAVPQAPSLQRRVARLCLRDGVVLLKQRISMRSILTRVPSEENPVFPGKTGIQPSW